MSILIKGMEMPANCGKCRFFAWSRGVGQHCAVASDITFHATIDGMDVAYERNGNCPLVPIPAADVVEVVRCEKCWHSYLEPYAAGIAHRICAYGMGADCEVEDDFYCAFGVKRDESEGEVIHNEIRTETAPADR